jgi:hypothetical protein
LRVHNGMSKRYRRLFIDEYFRLKYKWKMRANTRIYVLILTNKQKPPRFYVLFWAYWSKLVHKIGANDWFSYICTICVRNG